MSVNAAHRAVMGKLKNFPLVRFLEKCFFRQQWKSGTKIKSIFFHSKRLKFEWIQTCWCSLKIDAVNIQLFAAGIKETCNLCLQTPRTRRCWTGRNQRSMENNWRQTHSGVKSASNKAEIWWKAEDGENVKTRSWDGEMVRMTKAVFSPLGSLWPAPRTPNGATRHVQRSSCIKKDFLGCISYCETESLSVHSLVLLFVRPALVTSQLISTIWCSRTFSKLIIWWWQWPRQRNTKRQIQPG